MYTYMDVCVHHHIDIHCAQGVAYDSSCGGNSGWASPFEYFKTWKAVMGPRRWHTLLYIPIPGHATLGWELHGFASAVMLASTLFSSDTASCKSVSTVSGVRPFMSHDLILHMVPSMSQPTQASIASNLFFEAWFPLRWMAMLSVFFATTFNWSSNSLSSPWNTFLWLWNRRSPVCVYLVMYTYAYTYVCIYIHIYIYRYISHACGHTLYIRSCMWKLLCGKAHGGNP